MLPRWFSLYLEFDVVDPEALFRWREDITLNIGRSEHSGGEFALRELQELLHELEAEDSPDDSEDNSAQEGENEDQDGDEGNIVLSAIPLQERFDEEEDGDEEFVDPDEDDVFEDAIDHNTSVAK